MKFTSWALSALLTVSSTTLIQGQNTVGAFQSGPNAGPLYAAEIVHEESSDEFYVTGISYDDGLDTIATSDSHPSQSSCMVGKVQGGLTQIMKWEKVNVLGSADKLEACRGLTQYDSNTLIAVGNSELGGLYANSGMVQDGFIMAVGTGNLKAKGGLALYKDSIPYIQSVVTDDDGNVYIASMTAETYSENDIGTNYPDWTNRMKHGEGFELTVEKLKYNKGKKKFVSSWVKNLPVDPDDNNGNKPNVYVGGMVLKKGVGLIVAGSTNAIADGYGSAEGHDEDGFITIFDPSNGNLIEDRTNNKRIGTTQYDKVNAVCNDPAEPSFIYIVGATKGNVGDKQSAVAGSLQGFLQKLDLDGLIPIWTVQWGAQKGDEVTQAIALDCHVAEDVIYAAGTVRNGAGMVQGQTVHESQGGDDIWISQVDPGDGEVEWLQQIGSAGDDRLAEGGGLTADNDDNAILYGTTNGPLFRHRDISEMTDVFVMTVDYDDGSFSTTASGDVHAVVDDDDDSFGAKATFSVSNGALFHQAGPNAGALYASSFQYDADSGRVIVLGISYTEMNGSVGTAPSCLLAEIEVDTMETDKTSVLGSPNILEACRGLSLVDDNTLVVVGNSDPGGLYASGAQVQAGFGMKVDRSDLQNTMGLSLFSDRVPYPVSVITSGDAVYVASMTSNEMNENTDLGTFPNWAVETKHGRNFEMTIERVDMDTFESKWAHTFDIDPEADGSKETVHVGGMILKNKNVLVVVGSTRGKGTGYGPAEGDDEDGYITYLNPTTGELLSGRDNNVRIGSYEDDVVSFICDDPRDSNAYYIGGATKGDIHESADPSIASGSMQGFISKMNYKTLEATWTVQFGAVDPTSSSAPTTAYSIGCHSDGKVVYVSGVVENDAEMKFGDAVLESRGGDDFFVAQLQSKSGDINWLQQYGSTGDDHLAYGNSVAMDKYGNALIYGDTTGGLSRKREIGENVDIFVGILHRDDGTLVREDEYGSQPVLSQGSDDKGNAGKVIGIIVLVVVVLSVLFCVYRRCCSGSRRDNSQKRSDPNIVALTSNGRYSDNMSPSSYRDEEPNLVGNFHKTYSDLPGKGKEII